MKVLTTKELKDFAKYGGMAKNNKPYYRGLDVDAYKSHIVESIDTASMSKPDFFKMLRFVRRMNLLIDSMDDYAKGFIPLEEMQQDMQQARDAIDNLPSLSDNGMEIAVPSRNFVSLQTADSNEVDAVQQDYMKRYPQIKEAGMEDDFRQLASLEASIQSFAASLGAFENSVFDNPVSRYLEEVDRVYGTSFSEELFGDYGSVFSSRKEGNDHLVIHELEAYNMILNTEAGKEYKPVKEKELPLDFDLMDSSLIPSCDLCRLKEFMYECEANKAQLQEEKEVLPVSKIPTAAMVKEATFTDKDSQGILFPETENKSVPSGKNEKASVVLSNGKTIDGNVGKEIAETLKDGAVIVHNVFGEGIFTGKNEKGNLLILFKGDKEPKLLTPHAFDLGLMHVEKSKKKRRKARGNTKTGRNKTKS